MTQSRLLPQSRLLALLPALLLAACGSAPSPAAPDTAEVVAGATFTPSAAAQAQLAQFQQGLTEAGRLGGSAGLSAQALDCPTALTVPYDATTLNTGLYWYAPSTADAPGGVGCRARPDGGAIAGYYDPSKPVVVFVHGWQPNYVRPNLTGTQSTGRYTFWFPEGAVNVADNWVKAGWNVAMFHWTQLADDEASFFMPFNAQAKVWTTGYKVSGWGTEQPIGMRYMTPDGYSTKDAPTVSAGELFYQAYKSALQGWQYAGPEPVRVVGHSLGAQMALALADHAYRDEGLPEAKKPARIALVDPYWSPNLPAPGHSYAYLAPDPHPAARSARIAAAVIEKGAVIDWVKSSPVLDLGGDNNAALLQLVTRTELNLGYIPNPGARHNAGGRWYLLSREGSGNATTAAKSQAEAAALMREKRKYAQLTGWFTPTLLDDSFWPSPF